MSDRIVPPLGQASTSGPIREGETLTLLVLLWLSGAAIRIPLLGIPPLLPLIRDALGMSETEVGLLMSLPLAVLALAAVPGSLILARLGATRTMAAGLLVTAVAAASRSIAPDVALLYAATVLMGFGIAVGQASLPVAAREWLPRRTGVAIAAFINGSLVGAVLTSWLTIPVVLPWVGGSWRLAIAVWSVPVLFSALIFAIRAPQSRPPSAAAAAPATAWWPDWKSPLTWVLGLCFGANNSIYFGLNAFLPDYLHAGGTADLITAALTALNLAQLVASFIMLSVAEQVQRRAWTYLVFGPGALIGIIGLVVGNSDWTTAFAALTGFSTAINYTVMLALPAVLSPRHDVHRTAAGMFTIGFGLPVIVPVISGALWDITGIAWAAFVPFMVCAVGLTVLGPILVRYPAHSEAEDSYSARPSNSP